MQNIERHLRIPGKVEPRVESVRILGSRYLNAIANATNRPQLLHSTVTQRLHSAPDGQLLLLGNQFEGVRKIDDDAVDLTVEYDKMDGILSNTRHESSRGVVFGQLLIDDADIAPMQEYVAIKPHKIERAAREAIASNLINSMSNITGMQTYEPLGFLKTKKGNASLITRYIPSTLTFDNVLWSERETITEQQIADALGKSAMLLATMHAAMAMTHGDAQPKNMAWNHKTDQPWAVDLEDTRRHIRDSAWDFGDVAYADLATLLLYQPDHRSQDVYSYVADQYIDRYKVISGAGAKPPISKKQIVDISNNELQPLPRIVGH